MATGCEGADAGMAWCLRSSCPVSSQVAVGETQQHTTAGASRGFGAQVMRTKSTVAGLQSSVATIFGWVSGLWSPSASQLAGLPSGDEHDETDGEYMMSQWMRSEQKA